VALDLVVLTAAVNRVFARLDVQAQIEAFPTHRVPAYEHGQQPGSFSLTASDEPDWETAIGDVFETVHAEPPVTRAVELIAARLPAAVRDGEHAFGADPQGIAGMMFCALCEIAADNGPAHSAATTATDMDRRVSMAADQFEAFCDTSQHQLVWTVPLGGVRLASDLVVIADDVALKPMDDGDRRDLWRRVGVVPAFRHGQSRPGIREVAAADARIEVTANIHPGEIEPAFRRLQESVDVEIDVLRLLGAGQVERLASWLTFPKHALFLTRLYPWGVMTPLWSANHLMQRDDRVVVSDAELLARLYQWRQDVTRWPEKERQVFEMAFRRFSQTYERDNDDDRLIDAWIAFEALFLPEDAELSYRAQMRIARFVGADLAERERIRDDLKTSYKMRSKVVHGAIAKAHSAHPAADITNTTVEILRQALRRWMNPETDRSAKALDQALLS